MTDERLSRDLTRRILALARRLPAARASEAERVAFMAEKRAVISDLSRFNRGRSLGPASSSQDGLVDLREVLPPAVLAVDDVAHPRADDLPREAVRVARDATGHDGDVETL